MKTCAVIPIKSFSKAKTRLKLSSEKTQILCNVMFEEVLQTVADSACIEKIILVSKEEEIFKIGKKFNCIEICDDDYVGISIGGCVLVVNS